MSHSHYVASEDSALLRQAISEYSGRMCLEIGAGNAGALIELSERFTKAVGTDIVRPSMMDWKKAGAEFLLTDGASCIRSSIFDLVAFNPPYLPTEVGADPAVEGGERLEGPMKFLSEALRVVRPGGKVVMLLNDQADVSEFEKVCADAGFQLRSVASRQVFFEELTVFVASAISSQTQA